MVKKFLFVLCLVFLLSPSMSTAWEGKVIGVKDGRTVIVFDGNNPPVSVGLKGVRLAGQKDRDRDAMEFISRMVFNKRVEIKDEVRADGGSVTGEVLMRDGKSLNAELLKQDFARDGGQAATPVAVDQSPRETYSPAPVYPAKPSREYSSSSKTQNAGPSPAAGVRKWRDKDGNIHFSGTVGGRD